MIGQKKCFQNPTNQNAVTYVRQSIGDDELYEEIWNGETRFQNVKKMDQNLPVVSNIERGKFINKLIPFTNTFFRINFALKN